MTITEAQARRALRHADIPWDAEVDDPREGAWVVHHHEGILGGLAAAFSVGCRSLRRAEDFFADLGVGARRALGLGRGKPCDTTLYRLLAGQSPVGLEETVFAQVKNLIARKVVRNDRLALGVMSFDGKGTWSRTDGKKVKGAQQSAYDADGSSLQTFGALRATLTSSSACPCVGQKLIGSKEGEATAFRELLPRVCDELGGQFRIVTGDAGLCARENAALVSELGRWYVFGLKGNQPHRTASHASTGTTPSANPWRAPSRSTAATPSSASCMPATWPAIPRLTSRTLGSSGTFARRPTTGAASASPRSSGTSSPRSLPEP